MHLQEFMEYQPVIVQSKSSTLRVHLVLNILLSMHSAHQRPNTMTSKRHQRETNSSNNLNVDLLSNNNTE